MVTVNVKVVVYSEDRLEGEQVSILKSSRNMEMARGMWK